MKVEHFNGLSPAQAERLALLAEEMGEALQAIGKVLRHGYRSTHPDFPNGPNNRDVLEREIGDVLCALRLLWGYDLNYTNSDERAEIKAETVQKYLHHAGRVA